MRCHAERSGEESEAILTAESKHPCLFPNPEVIPLYCDTRHSRLKRPSPIILFMRDPRYYCVYIIGSLTGTLYIGVSGNLHKRVFQHKFHHYEGFTARYEVVRLLYWESYDDVHRALGREKQLKGWARAKKIALLERRNPQWKDLASEWYPWMERGEDRDASTPQ